MNILEINQNDLIRILCDETNWENHGIHPQKGLLLFGMTGVGKTFSLDVYLSETKKNPGHRIDGEKIEMGVSLYGAHYFERFLQDHMVWNDLGEEEKVMMYMGTTVKPAQSIIMNRHMRFPDLFTNITTNYTVEILENKYGDRVFSRLQQMCTFIHVTGKDLRK